MGHKKDIEEAERACSRFGVDYEVIDILSHDWQYQLEQGCFDGVLVRPAYKTQEVKNLCDERIYHVEKHLGIPVYPSFDEIYIYENKRNMASWLASSGFQHPKTHVFSNKEAARAYVETAKFPIVRKSNVGSAGLGVDVISDKKTAARAIQKAFRKYSEDRYLKNTVPERLKRILTRHNHSYFMDGQRGYVLFQEYLDVELEWRIIKIGNSYFGHQKLVGDNGLASGSDLVGWVEPPVELLQLVREICEVGQFNSMAVDILQTKTKQFYVNELQTIFGSYVLYQMKVNDVPGRYTYDGETYNFEEGSFNTNGCWDLRVEHFIEILKRNEVV